MPRQKSQICDFCHKRGHTEEKCWKKFPALRTSQGVCQLGIEKSLYDKGDGSTQPGQHHHDCNLVRTEQEQSSQLFTLPDELLLEIVSHLWAPEENGDIYLQSLKSFSLVSKRARWVTAESLPLTVSCYCSHKRPFRQILKSTGFLSQTKQLVLKPGLQDNMMNTDSSNFNQLMNLMPRLRELNIHFKVPLKGILSEGQLPLVKTLSVPINQAGYGCEATSIIRACPNVTRLRLNISGPLQFQTLDIKAVPRVGRPEAQRALEAAAALKSLRHLELSKFPTRSPEWNAGAQDSLPSDGLGNGWVPGDLQVIVGYLPNISSLAIYGTSGIPRTLMKFGARATTLRFVSECAGMPNLHRLSITTDFAYYQQRLFEAEKNIMRRDQDSAIEKAFETFPNLRELSFLACEAGTTWSTNRTDQKAGGANAKCLEEHYFVNSMYTSRMLEATHGIDRWF